MYPKLYLYMRIKDAKVLIDKTYMDNIDLCHVAKQVCLSKFHFLRLFKQAYGLTPRQYIINRRMEKAKAMLLDGVSLSEVCYKLGYVSLSSFSHLFKKHTSMNPGKFFEHYKSNFRQ